MVTCATDASARAARLRRNVPRRRHLVRVRGSPVGRGGRDLTREKITEAAERSGLLLSYSTLGPFFRAVARRSAGPGGAGDEGEEGVVGYVTGFLVPPLRYVHLDEMRVFRSRLGAGARVGAFGVGLIVGTYALTRARDARCDRAELLAINDDAHQFQRLVRYYRRMGFEAVREVGAAERGPWVDALDQITWGGQGMLMQASVADVLDQWARAFQEKPAEEGGN